MGIFLYILRVSLRDILIPISELAVLNEYFENSEFFSKLMMSQAIVFDNVDICVGLGTLWLFYKSGKQKIEDQERE